MASSLYLFQNGAEPTTAAPVKVTTGTAIKTLLQVQPKSGVYGRIVEWGISFDGSAAATPIEVELVETGSVAATVTATVAADITSYNPGDVAPATGLVTLGTSATGYTASAEGSITVTRELDFQLIAPTNQYVKQFPLGREPMVGNGNNVRIRVTAGAAVNAYCYMVIEF